MVRTHCLLLFNNVVLVTPLVLLLDEKAVEPSVLVTVLPVTVTVCLGHRAALARRLLRENTCRD